MFSAEFEKKQMHVNAAVMPLCVGKLRKVACAGSNWELYYNPAGGYCMSIAKDISGASDSIYGRIDYIYGQLRRGVIRKGQLTKYGRRVLREHGYNLEKV